MLLAHLSLGSPRGLSQSDGVAWGNSFDLYRGDGSAVYSQVLGQILLADVFLQDDGLCVFDITLKRFAKSEFTTGQELARAAWKLMTECVRDNDHEGGLIHSLGEFSEMTKNADSVAFLPCEFFSS